MIDHGIGIHTVRLRTEVGDQAVAKHGMRYRSDAWFHAAVIAQIGDYGIPPEDPYFAGLALQWMKYRNT